MASEQEIRQGVRRLRQLLPWARAEARHGQGRTELETALSQGQAAYVHEGNLEALIVYPAPLGGWHADVLLKQVPPGIPNSIGSPVSSPHRTRHEAEEAAKRLLVCILQIAEKHRQGSTGAPAFLLHGYSCQLLPKVYEKALTIMPHYRTGYGSPEIAAERVSQALDELCPEGFDGEAFNDWPRDRQIRLLVVLHIAALSGLFAYPPRQDATPSGHAAPPPTAH